MPALSSIRIRTLAISVTLTTLVVPQSRAVAAPKPAPSPETRRAGEAYQEGQIAFNLGQWDKAIEAWQRGYALKQDPVFLYNIGQAYRKEGDLEHALFFYKNYLRGTSNAPNKEEVTGWIEQLDKELVAEKQKEAAEAAARQRKADEDAQRAREEAARQAAQSQPVVVVEKPRELNGDIGVAAGVNLWVAGLRDAGVKPGAAVELSGGYTIVRRGRLSFRLGGTVAFTYLSDLHSTVNFFGFLVDPTLKVDLWKQKLFFYAQVGLGAGLMTGTSSTQTSYVTDSALHAAKGTFATFEARPAVGIEYLVIRRLSVLLAPGVAITPPYADHIATQARVQILAGLQIHL